MVKSSFILILSIIISACAAEAGPKTRGELGPAQKAFKSGVDVEVPLSMGETCVAPAPIGVIGAKYSKNDLKAINRLCSYDMHITAHTPTTRAVGICPKLWSTFPAVELFELPEGVSKASFEAKNCSRKAGTKTNGKKFAKYKYSTSCSTTGAIMGYYHISRALGMKIVPPTALRTMDRKAHIKVAERGTKKLSGSKELIAKTWRRLLSDLKSGKSPLMADSAKTLSIGALSDNPRGEQKYYKPFWLGKAGAAGVPLFKSSPAYKNIANKRPITDMIGTKLTDKNYRTIREMKDATDMLILDTLFGQKDRFGNTHSYHTFMTVDPATNKLDKMTLRAVGKLIKKKGTEAEKKAFARAEKMPKAWLKEVRKRDAIILPLAKKFLTRLGYRHAHSQELLLKDNDCGLKDSNIFMRHKLIEGVYHISKSTYEQLMKLATVALLGDLDAYLKDNLGMSSGQIDQFKDGLSYVSNNLRNKYDKGQLHLDLNVKSHFRGEGTDPIVITKDKTIDGFEIYDIIKVVNVRNGLILTEGFTDASKLIDGKKYETRPGDRVALIEYHTVGDYRMAHVEVVESEHLTVGSRIYIVDFSMR